MWKKKRGMRMLKMVFGMVMMVVLIFVAKQEVRGVWIKKRFYIIERLNGMELFIVVFVGVVVVLWM
ncbi:hypothetical protein, partial [Bacillus altitudinis]|uniref:hypothetical protein n=1 Tax=Bacillus altitudinis TaxID=293387 RepID=UPI001C92DF56